jgi:hypothetical protein
MPQAAEPIQPDNQAFDGRLILTVILCTLIAEALRDMSWLPYPIGIALVYYVVLIIGYWFGRRPALTFGRFTLRLTEYLIVS